MNNLKLMRSNSNPVCEGGKWTGEQSENLTFQGLDALFSRIRLAISYSKSWSLAAETRVKSHYNSSAPDPTNGRNALLIDQRNLLY
jgi:hypothetical protein